MKWRNRRLQRERLTQSKTPKTFFEVGTDFNLWRAEEENLYEAEVGTWLFR